MKEPLVYIKDARLSFFTPAGEVKALGGVTLTLREGEVLGVVGESGSGKSVTAYSLMGLVGHPGRLVGEKYFSPAGPSTSCPSGKCAGSGATRSPSSSRTP
jgi:oligopeptide transport system ATP-binding protein